MVTRTAASQPAQRAGKPSRSNASPDRTRAPAHATHFLELSGERMSKVDTAWLRMDSPCNLMMIIGVWTLRPGISYEDLRQRVQERLLKYPRFRQRVVEDAAGFVWVEDTAFDVERHVVREKLPRRRRGAHQHADHHSHHHVHQAADQAGLQERVAQLAMEPLDKNHPLWQFSLVEDYDGGSAMIVRIHHCIADGIALIGVTMSLMDGGAPPLERQRRQPDGAQDWIAETLVKPFTDFAVKALGVAGEGAARSLGMLAHPTRGIAGSVDVAKLAWQVTRDAAALALMPDDSKTRLKGKPGGTKRVAWCTPIPLDEVKAVGKALHCSVNDVLLSCVAGAIGGYLRGKGDDVTGQEIRAMVPVNLRERGETQELGNRFGLAPLVLPIGIENPIERIYELRGRMTALKGSTQPLLAFGLLALAGLMIKPGQDALLDLFGRKTTAVITNVPGPREKLRLLGASLEQSMFWVPQSGDVGLGVSILSYGGGVQFGVISDTTLCPDPQAIIDGFEPEFARLSVVTLMLPWGAEG